MKSEIEKINRKLCHEGLSKCRETVSERLFGKRLCQISRDSIIFVSLVISEKDTVSDTVQFLLDEFKFESFYKENNNEDEDEDKEDKEDNEEDKQDEDTTK